MKFRYFGALLVAAAVTCTGCGERDRKEAVKSGDGVESFRFVPRDPSKYTATPQKNSEKSQVPDQEKREQDTRRLPNPGDAR